MLSENLCSYTQLREEIHKAQKQMHGNSVQNTIIPGKEGEREGELRSGKTSRRKWHKSELLKDW